MIQAMNGIDEELLLDLIKICIAIICGGVIGMERELKDKPAGLRTNILVATGSCLFVVFGLKVAAMFDDDPGRIMGPIITGIGFLGAGTIIQARGNVRGLTSAATIWVVAGVGMSAGLGLFSLALATSILVLFILIILPRGERVISKFGLKYSEFIVVSKPNSAIAHWTRRIMDNRGIVCSRFQVKREKGMFRINFVARGREQELVDLLSTLLHNRDIMEAMMEDT